GECIRTLKGHSSWVNGATLIDAQTIMSWSNDSTLRLWDRATGECIRTLKGQSSWVNGATLIDAQTIMSWSGDGTLRLWDRRIGNCIKTLQGHSGPVHGASLIDPQTIMSWSWNGTVIIWDKFTLSEMIEHLRGAAPAAITTKPPATSGDDHGIIGAMHEDTAESSVIKHNGVDRAARRLAALRRLLKIKGIDLKKFVEEQQGNMGPEDKAALERALREIGLNARQINIIASRIILVEVPERVRLDGPRRIGGAIIRTQEGLKILFPKERIREFLHNIGYLGDLFHEIKEISLIAKFASEGMDMKEAVNKAHEQAIQARKDFIQGREMAQLEWDSGANDYGQAGPDWTTFLSLPRTKTGGARLAPDGLSGFNNSEDLPGIKIIGAMHEEVSPSSTAPDSTVGSTREGFSGEGSFVARLRLPDKLEGTLEQDMRGVVSVFKDQFGGKRLGTDKSPVALGEKGLATTHAEGGWFYVTLRAQGALKHRSLQVRLMAHEVQHSWNSDYDNLLYRLQGVAEFQALQRRFADRFDAVMGMGLSEQPFLHDREYYQTPDEILARLRAYQVFLQQGADAGEHEYHEFFEILTKDDLRWLDINYLRRVTEGVSIPENPPIVISDAEINAANRQSEPKTQGPAGNGPGGVDFRAAMPITAQPAPLSTIQQQSLRAPEGRSNPSFEIASVASLPRNDDSRTISASLDKEWQEMQKILQAGIIPSSQRLKEYLMASCTSSDCQEQVNKILSCIADILRLEEERCCNTDAALRQILVLLESDKPVNELQLALSKIG
ncbi:MAG: hypothetical protein NTU54_03710, partial [Candidatus Omnitrophica bacterium]|nr:hypothetical protein [Candidatus Omnitrophota bacterium]